ncbi:hypothetical protein DKX38_000967 [Salix brachista]|uniref:Tetraspanin n=1 Tax=Salix brachista TaxID=2182728 RepID=A0A5N5P458_9ROSI|nr:hypothetical protein DKX38_000967 [Salix brachista]
MARKGDYFLCFLNILTLLISMTIVVQISKTWEIITFYGNANCASFLRVPVFILGAALLIISVLGLMALFCRASPLHRVYLWAKLLLVIVLLGFTVFSSFVTDKGPRETDSGRDQSRLQDFSGWLQGHVVNENKWVRIKKCLIKTRVCQEYAQKLSALPSDVLLEMLIPAESGCCMPPSNCGYRFKNATFWDAPKSGLDSKGDECLSWKNGQENLCYNCETCKAGYLQEVRNIWKALNIFNTCFIIYLTLILAFGFLCLPIDQSRRL